MQVVRLHDRSRNPASWTEMIRPGQFAAFSKDEATGGPCDAEGRPFADIDAATCVLFDGMADARAFCEAAVERHPSLRFDIFDAEGRARPPLLTVLHSARADALETSPAQMHTRRNIAVALTAAGVPLVVYACFDFAHRILPAFLGIKMVVVAARLSWMNLAIRETERARQERVGRAEETPQR